MGIENVKEGKLLYHLTTLSNLDSIIKKGLMTRKQLITQDQPFIDVADFDIITKRASNDLQEYIPFHFHPYSAFDVAVKNQYNNEEFIYITIQREWAKSQKFKILPIHPLTQTDSFQLYDYDEGFKQIDWETMHSIGNDTNYKKQVKMAECVTREVIQTKNFHCIYVKNQTTRQLVKKKLKENNVISLPPFVDIGLWFDT